MVDDSKHSLRDRIRSFLTAEFNTFSPDDVAGVLNDVASEFIQLSEAGVQALSEAVDTDPHELMGYRVVAESDQEVMSLIHQTLKIGAVVVAGKPSPALNEVIELEISFPSLKHSLTIQGRVVHITPSGAAVELDPLSKDDRVTLESMRENIHKVEASAEFDRESTASSVPEAASGPSFNASDSIPIPNIVARSTLKGFRRNYDVTSPDVKVLSAVHKTGRTSGEYYGPEPSWFEMEGDPLRVEALADDRVVDVLLQMSEDGATGLVEFESDKVRRQVLMEGGFIVESSNRPRRADEELGLMLFRADRITNQQLLMAAAHADEKKNDIARSLMDLSILDPERIRNALAGRLTFLLREISDMRNGTFKYYGNEHLPAGFLPAPPLRVHVPVERVIFRKLFEALKPAALKVREEAILPYLEAYPEVSPEQKDRMERSLTDDAHQLFTNRLLGGRRRLKEVFTESGLPHADTYAVVFALHRMGLVRFDRSLHHTIIRERYRENVTVKYLSVHKASYFEVLNVHWSSYTSVVQRAYNDLIEQFDPEQVPGHLEDEVHQRVSEIRDRVESAYQVLCDRETRHAYRKRIMPEYKLVHAVPLFNKQCELAERRRQWTEGLDAIERVIEIEPDDRNAKMRRTRLIAIIENRLSPDAADSNF